ncbi:MAG: hypothetical protein WCL50_13330, partial [Spirochaetota bacterium]
MILASVALEMLAIFALLPQPEILVAFDAAFAASRPELVEEISRVALIDRRLVYLVFPIDVGPSRLVELLGKRRSYPRVIAVSPILARALVEGAARNGAAPPGRLVVIEGSEKNPDLASLQSDPLPAYRRAGELIGGILADYRNGSAWSGDPAPAATAALFFSPGAGRPEAAKEAFSAGWTLKASFPLKIEEIPEGASEAEAASRLRILVEGDLKAILMAVGGSGLGALKQ